MIKLVFSYWSQHFHVACETKREKKKTKKIVAYVFKLKFFGMMSSSI